MKNILKTLLLSFFLFGTQSIFSQSIERPRISPAAEVIQTIGNSTITINYSRPAIKKREGSIWGKLVPYGYIDSSDGRKLPWRTGANENTVLTISHDARIEGKLLKAGTYGLFIVVYENDEVKVIFSNNSTMWASSEYKKSEDALRIKTNLIDNAYTESLTYQFDNIKDTEATIVLDWEHKRIPFKIEFPVAEIFIKKMNRELSRNNNFKSSDIVYAAYYLISKKVHLDVAEKWVDQAIAIEKNGNTLSAKARIYFIKGDRIKGLALRDEAIALENAGYWDYYTYGHLLLRLKLNDKALEVYLKQNKKWPESWFSQYGLAKAYLTLGKTKKALKYAYEADAKKQATGTEKKELADFIKKLEAKN